MNKAATIHQNLITHKSPLVRLHRECAYHDDPTQVFHALCMQHSTKQNSLLLESAEVDSKANLKSLLLIDAALRIECRGQQVELTALTQNGQAALDALAPNLTQFNAQRLSQENLTLTFTPSDETLDEDTRLKSASSFDALRLIQHSFDLTDHDKFSLFLGGLFAYDLVANFEAIGEVPALDNCPDYVFYLAETLMIFDHQAQVVHLQASAFNPSEDNAQLNALELRLDEIAAHYQDLPALPKAQQIDEMKLTTNIDDQDFNHIVSDLKRYVVRGDVFQVVPSRRFMLPCPSPLAAYKALKKSNPSPYMFYMQDALFTLFGASPESALKYETQTNQVEIYPIAGTRRRGKNPDGSINPDLDSRIELELRCDTKENAEHMMLVDLARNDVARISNPGTRFVADLLKVDRYSHVMHLVSRVVGQLRDDLDALHAYQASMNMGTLTGAPKVRAMDLIRDVEQARRGSYGGAVGYLTGEGDLDTCIVIRSAYVENGIASIQAGAGVVFDSVPQAETDETRGKAQAVISAITQAHQPTHS
ncbi:MAG: anthranilate synthase component 1 [Vibrio sp.]